MSSERLANAKRSSLLTEGKKSSVWREEGVAEMKSMYEGADHVQKQNKGVNKMRKNKKKEDGNAFKHLLDTRNQGTMQK